LREEICEALYTETEAHSDKYLGLPVLVGADRSDCFLHFVEKIIQRFNGWKEKLLSIGRKEIILKAVAQAIPVFAMSVFHFQIPKGVCKRMMDVIAEFWWGDDENSNKMHWIIGNFATQRNKGALDSEISSLSILPCLPKSMETYK
jgi:hypothetical protein